MLGVLEKEKRDNECSDKKSNDKKSNRNNVVKVKGKISSESEEI